MERRYISIGTLVLAADVLLFQSIALLAPGWFIVETTSGNAWQTGDVGGSNQGPIVGPADAFIGDAVNDNDASAKNDTTTDAVGILNASSDNRTDTLDQDGCRVSLDRNKGNGSVTGGIDNNNPDPPPTRPGSEGRLPPKNHPDPPPTRPGSAVTQPPNKNPDPPPTRPGSGGRPPPTSNPHPSPSRPGPGGRLPANSNPHPPPTRPGSGVTRPPNNNPDPPPTRPGSGGRPPPNSNPDPPPTRPGPGGRPPPNSNPHPPPTRPGPGVTPPPNKDPDPPPSRPGPGGRPPPNSNPHPPPTRSGPVVTPPSNNNHDPPPTRPGLAVRPPPNMNPDQRPERPRSPATQPSNKSPDQRPADSGSVSQTMRNSLGENPECLTTTIQADTHLQQQAGTMSSQGGASESRQVDTLTGIVGKWSMTLGLWYGRVCMTSLVTGETTCDSPTLSEAFATLRAINIVFQTKDLNMSTWTGLRIEVVFGLVAGMAGLVGTVLTVKSMCLRLNRRLTLTTAVCGMMMSCIVDIVAVSRMASINTSVQNALDNHSGLTLNVPWAVVMCGLGAAFALATSGGLLLITWAERTGRWTRFGSEVDLTKDGPRDMGTDRSDIYDNVNVESSNC